MIPVVVLICFASGGICQENKPLLIPGKKTLFQRVITHPGADLFSGPEASRDMLKEDIDAFTIYYVYQRIDKGDDQWLQVGISSRGDSDGWVQGTKVSDWNQSMTLVFTERTGRKPVLFFKTLQSLENVAGSSSPTEAAIKLAQTFQNAQKGRIQASDELPVLAMEPSGEAVARDRFYLMPIFQAIELFEGVKFLEVACIDPGSGLLMEEKILKTGIAFVIDTTISMRPYIERTRSAVRNIYDALEKARLSDKVAFALVGFRNSVEKTPELEYVSRIFSDFKDGRNRVGFEQALSTISEADTSTHSFNEDAFTGLKTAIDGLDWAPYPSRLIFLITDAGAIRNDDPYSSTGMNETEIGDLAESKGIKIFALHLKTPAGKRQPVNNHIYAENQYRTLTRHSDITIKDLYVPIEAGKTSTGVEGFGNVVESVAQEMVHLVQATASGERIQLPERSVAGVEDPVNEAKRKAAILGYAMQLDFLGQKAGIQAPEVVKAWVSDMDLTKPDRPAFQVSVLLTKNQLSDLYQRLKMILDHAQRTKRTGAKDFFESVLSAAAQMSRDPIQFSRTPNQQLSRMGVLSEFLDGLPYRSSIMRLTEEDWYRMSVGEQQALIDDLKSKVRRYRKYHDDVSNWISFGASDPGESYYRVPLGMMP